MNHDPIDYEDQRQARDHYRAVNKLIGEEDIAIIDRALKILWTFEDTLGDYPHMQEAIEDLNGLLTDIVLPEGIGANDENYGNAVSAHLAKRDARTKAQAS